MLFHQLHTTDNTNQIHTVQSIDQTAHNNTEMTTVDLTEATLGQDGQLIITGEDGQGKGLVVKRIQSTHRILNKSIRIATLPPTTGYPVSVSGMITLPVNSSMYQTMVANIQQLQSNQDGTLCITPMQVQKYPQNRQHHYRRNGNTNTTNSSNSSYRSRSACSSSNCLLSTTAATTCPTSSTTTPSTALRGVTAVGYPLYNPYATSSASALHRPPQQHPSLFGQLSIGFAAAAACEQLKKLASTDATQSAAAVRSRTVEPMPNSSSQHGNKRNTNADGSLVANLVPKVEQAEKAEIDPDGNIILRFGDGAPIKIECDSSDVKI